MATTIRGTNRNDTLQQNGRPEVRIFGLDGNDKIGLDRDDDLGGNNFVDAGRGRDLVANAFEGGNRILLGAGDDKYVGLGFDFNFADRVEGGDGNDQFFLTTNISTYVGGKGNDIFHSEGHKNDFIGGTGIDTISYKFRHESSVVGDEGVTISLGENAAQTGSNSLEELISIENAIGSLNSDIIGGSNGANKLSGLAGDDDVFGFGGNDVLDGGAGIDFLFGGAGADRFVFSSLSHSQLNRPDEIKDFSQTEGDRIDLSAIDANPNLVGNQAFEFIGSDFFSGNGGEVRFTKGMLLVDISGDADSEMAFRVFGVSDLQQSDFIL
ncbi:calcium-binding protein [Rhizobium alvei]|uniref:Calcium-binding protein n=1 Tax=Rhizobium alvei TaxID=1132659 RepID=A0ABT8YM21_9HYPH|nr:calcium-binding protein [Rhizobium alvei]MDO6964770.1 calcium-binding protein [Rhizobium alvei]